MPRDAIATPSAAAVGEWTVQCTRLIQDLSDIAMARADGEVRLNDRLDEFMRAWPAGIDVAAFSKRFFATYRHRPHILMLALRHFRRGAIEHQQLAREIDEKLLTGFVSTVSLKSGATLDLLPFVDRSEYLKYVGQLITATHDPTVYLRNHLNPIEQYLVELIETQRYSLSLAHQALECGLAIACVALEVSVRYDGAKIEHRRGLAVDYLHWLGRLIRSDIASHWLMWEMPDDSAREALALASDQSIAVQQVLGGPVDVALKRVMADPLVPPQFKEKFCQHT
jgi:hypothetical protein